MAYSAAANRPSGPLKTYETSCRSIDRSYGSEAIDVVTVASSSPRRRTADRHGGSHSSTSHRTFARTAMKPIVTS